MAMVDRDATSTSRHVNPAWILLGIVIAFTGYDALLSWYLDDRAPEWLGPAIAGAWVFQAHMFAIWAALGPGKLLLRLPPVVAGFFIVLGAPAVHPDGIYERREFLALVLTAAGIFAITTILLLVVRRFAGWQIEREARPRERGASRYQFDLRYLIGVITLYAVTLGIYTNIAFKPPEPPTAFILFGPDFVIRIIVYAGAIAAALLLPIISVPLFFLNGRIAKRPVYVAAILWAIIAFAFAAFWETVEGEGLEFFVMTIVVQAGAATAGVLTALPLRLAGYRLESRTKPVTRDAK